MTKLDSKTQSIFNQMSVDQVGDEWHLDMPAKLDRKTYEKIKQIVNGLRGEWVRQKNTHVFRHDPTPEIATIAETGITPDYIDNPHAFFPTPIEEVEDMVYLLGEVRDWGSYRVLEPNAGDGRIVETILKYCPDANIDYCEIDDRNRELLKRLPANCVGHDFLAANLEPVYDLIIMNPPFNGKEYQKHVKKAFGLLKPNGRIVALMPQMCLADRAFCNILFKNAYSEIHLGDREFVGTKVKYVVVVADKCVHTDNVPAGYKTWAEYNLLVALDNDYEFHKATSGVTDRDKIKKAAAEAVDRMVTNDLFTVCFDDELAEVVAQYYLGEPEPVKDAEPVQRSLFDLAA